jgi:hypothetical protein
MRSLPISLVVVVVLLPLVALLATGAAGSEVVVGRPHSSVVKLTSENYDEYVTEDDATTIRLGGRGSEDIYIYMDVSSVIFF